MRLEVELPKSSVSILLDRNQAEQPLSRILRHKHHPLNTRCGGKDLCGACSVELLEGRVAEVAGERIVEVVDGPVTIRACRFRADSEVVRIRVPQRALLAYRPQILGDYRLNVPVGRDPLTSAKLGVAVDIGTTTVVVQVVDLRSGKALARTSAFNKQVRLGDDVLTRINLCSTDPTMLGVLQEAVARETVRPLLDEALASIDESIEHVGAYVFAGNTTMLHLLAGEDPSTLGYSPFTPRFLDHRVMKAGELGLKPAEAEAHLLPGAAAYVGADLTSGALASGLIYESGPSLLVDVGTNGEMMLKYDSRLLGCATAAGPAFEGSGLHSGMRAGDGAVSRLRVRTEPFGIDVDVIGPEGTLASGVCGSAYVDLLGQGAAAGLLTMAGRFDREVVTAHGEWFVDTECGPALAVATGQGGRKVLVTEADIAALLQAKAAIAAGILTLLQNVGMRPADVKTLHLAGGFGMYLDLENAFRCGLLPGFKAEQVQLVGNTSLAGAFLSLLDRGTIDELARIGGSMESIELNLDPGFEGCYIDNLMLSG